MKKIFISILLGLLISSCINNSNSTVSIGKQGTDGKEQIWMIKNLDVTTYRDGTSIPEVTDPAEWANLTTGAWCYYNNDSANGKVYGKLYNWYAVNDPRGLAPEGFHIPNADEWNALTEYLSISSVDNSIGDKIEEGGTPGLKMKEAGTTHWTSPNDDATNSSGFTGLPGGERFDNGTFKCVGLYGYWWSSTDEITNKDAAWQWNLSWDSWGVEKYYYKKTYGLSVRCLKD
ncbi:fibrobacter succinogenes major paralogous domain-containing protein [Flavobacterium sp. N1994]|uniref:fibrobacter succinogenes major paralogous domain-containing protein n=1 Tax=Flavobacterium sp. N1994 TaxID=2986827 RepID=UPI00222180ED|nr:fibrobacter succinogenes major paralogous domain-containing protein [Flavobacterium sp. N1994]